MAATRIEPIAVTGVATAGAILTVTVDRPGDFSEYRLSVVDDDPDRSPLAGFDPQLSAIRFTFKVDCPTGFDCVSDEDCPPGSLDEAEIDYLAKDYASFRRLMLDRMAVVAPDWHERNPADLQVALVELLAFVGDRLSYFQDAVATEAYLGTARRRDSVRRHARLLDYRMHDGCNARTWIHVAVDGGAPVEVPAGTVIVERTDPAQDAILSAPELATVLAREAPIVFETRATITARGAHNEIPLHPWSEIGCCLPIGATRATLRNDAGKPLALMAGECLLFEEIKGPSGEAADADPAHRQVVRLSRVVDARPGQPAGSLTDELDGTHIVEVEWDPRDALTFPLCLSAIADDGTTVNADLSVARGNLVLADHGLKTPVALIPDEAPIGRSFRPILDAGPVACGEAVDPRAAASAALVQDPARALPLVELAGDGATWAPQKDLLGSGPYAAEFVAEVAESGPARLRFGDGASGRRPSEGSTFSAVARIGNGTLGNVGSDTLTRVRWEGGGIAVRNPVAAIGGTDPESADAVRLLAPRAFRHQERAVTEADYATVAMRRPEVGKAAGRIRWTGSWYTAVVTADRPGGAPVDPPFSAGLLEHLDLFRMAGVDLDVDRPIDVPLDIELVVCAEPDHLASEVKRRVLDALSRRRFASGELGFFHPDNWTFGQPLFLSQLYRAVMRVDGISWVDANHFHRFGRAPNCELEDGVMRAAPREVLRLDNDPNFRERGRLVVDMRGGR